MRGLLFLMCHFNLISYSTKTHDNWARWKCSVFSQLLDISNNPNKLWNIMTKPFCHDQYICNMPFFQNDSVTLSVRVVCFTTIWNTSLFSNYLPIWLFTHAHISARKSVGPKFDYFLRKCWRSYFCVEPQVLWNSKQFPVHHSSAEIVVC